MKHFTFIPPWEGVLTLGWGQISHTLLKQSSNGYFMLKYYKSQTSFILIYLKKNN